MIEIRGLHKSFADKKVLQGVDLDIATGETTTIIGGSGSGKSVLFKHIIGLMKPDSGSILVDGADITQMGESDLYGMVEKFGLVFQSGALFDSMTVGQNVAFGMKNRKGMTSTAIAAAIEHSLGQVGLADIAHMLPAELSGGMKKRVAIARVIARKPMIIMFDEPTTGLDPIMADIINDLIIKVTDNKEITSIVITHDMVSAYKISDKIAVLYEGRIVETGSADEIRQTQNAVVRQFIEGRAEGPIKIR